MMPKRRAPSGFTLVELMFVVTLILTLSFLAFPSLRTFSSRDKDGSAATFIVHEFNRVKTQAQMRNRAYIVRFNDFSAAQARGTMEVFESRNTSCDDAIANLGANAIRLAIYGYGATFDPGRFNTLPGGSDKYIGLTGWMDMGAVPPAFQGGGDLTLCIRTDGSLLKVVNGAVDHTPPNRMGLLVQRFNGSGPEGPARHVRFDVFQPARLELQ